MNRLLTRKKTKEDLREGRPSVDSPTPPLPQPSNTTKRRWGRKKNEAEAKPQLDLTLALPASDDFRTSLIMPNLSARFSMLRDQDNPASLIGKASDDSVLTAHRRSRIYASSGLGDIAETASISSGTFRPPFAAGGRSASYHTADGYGSDGDSYSGSIMSRARPGEGNVLFGGRQKIYKIPIGDAGSVSNLGSNESRGMRGRALYEDDVSVSAFQKMKEKERQLERERKLAELEREMESDGLDPDSLNSPALSSYDVKRETTSSTNSAPSAMSASTAATSVMSQHASSSPGLPPTQSHSHANGTLQSSNSGLQRSNSKRLYDQRLDQNMAEQQSANLARMNSLQRLQSPNGRSTPTSIHGSWRERSVSAESSRPASPLLTSTDRLNTSDAVRNSNRSASSTGVSPVSPHPFGYNPSDREEIIAKAVDANDRGKATALGQFNRPRQFDESQFLARQRSLHQQKNDLRPAPPTTSPVKALPRRPSAESRFASHNSSARPSGETSRNTSGRPSIEQQLPGSRTGPSRPQVTRPQVNTRAERVADRPGRMPSPASAQKLSPNALLEDSPTMGGRLEWTPKPSAQAAPRSPNSTHLSPNPDEGDGFTKTLTPKISFERGTTDDAPPPLRNPQPSASAPSLHDHPAMRSQTSLNGPDQRDPWPLGDRSGGSSPTIPAVHTMDVDKIATTSVPTANNAKGQNHLLGGMVREHLRQPSNVSSVYDDDEDIRKSRMLDNDIPVPFLNGGPSNPWSNESLDAGAVTKSSNGFQLEHMGSEPDLKPVPSEDVAAELLREHPGPRPEDADQWMEELRKRHARGASTESQAERKAFDDEIAARKRAIQENLKIKAQNSNRAPAPVTQRQAKPFVPLPSLSRDRSPVAYDQPGRAKKILGLGIGQSGDTGPNGNRAVGGPRGVAPAPGPGRTLHSRMPEPRRSEDSYSPVGRPRQNSLTSDRHHSSRRSPPDSSRTSTSRDGNSSSDQSKRSMDIPRRGEFQSPFSSSRPSEETQRQRAKSDARNRPPVPQLPTNNSAAGRPQVLSREASASSVPSTAGGRSIVTSGNTTPSISSPDLRGETNTSLSQTAFASQAMPKVPQNLPNSVYTFPARKPGEKPTYPASIGRRNRSPTLSKKDISEPTFISSTSNFETIDLPHAQALGSESSSRDVSGATSPTLAPKLPPVNPLRQIFARRGSEGRRGSEDSQRPRIEEDDYVSRPSGGRLRIRKVSSEDGSIGRRHRLVDAGVFEARDNVAGGMI